MADNTHQYGFRLFKWLGEGSQPDIHYHIVATAFTAQDDGTGFTVDLNIGDPVEMVDDGTVNLANGGDLVYGIIVSVEPYWDGSAMKPTDYLPTATAWGTNYERASRVGVVLVNQAIWECDFDSTSQPTTRAGWETLIHNNFPHVCPGDSSTKKAEPYIDVSAAATTAGLEWRCIGLSPSLHNKDLAGANVKGLFMANASQVAGVAATPVAGV